MLGRAFEMSYQGWTGWGAAANTAFTPMNEGSYAIRVFDTTKFQVGDRAWAWSTMFKVTYIDHAHGILWVQYAPCRFSTLREWWHGLKLWLSLRV